MLSKSKTPNTPTISSFASIPISVATEALAFPKPSGVNITEIPLPITPKMLASKAMFMSSVKLPPTNPTCENVHIPIEASRMIVPAFFMYELPRSYIECIRFLKVGIWYGGSSITNGAGSLINGFVFFRMIPERTTATTPAK